MAGYDANLLGTAGSVAFGLSGLDFYKDLSDIAHGLENWENTPGDYLNLGVNLIALLPVIGAFKNLGKPATDAASHVAKQIDDEVANLRAIGANNRSAPDFHNNISQRQPGGYLRASKSVRPLTQAQESAIRKINNIEEGHLKPHDFTGTLRDMTGNPVPKPGGGFWDHAQEMNNSLRGLRKHAKTLEGATDPAAIEARQRALELIKKIEEHTRGAGI